MNNDEQNCSIYSTSTGEVSTFRQDGSTELQIDVLQSEDDLSECYVLGYN